MSVIHKELNTAAQVARLSDVLSFIEQNLEEAGFTFKDVMQINLAVEEIFVNVASYAYPDGDGSAEIIIDIEETPLSATIKVIDSGIPFNPLEHEDPDVTLNFDNLEYLCQDCHNLEHGSGEHKPVKDGLFFDENGDLRQVKAPPF